MTSYTTLKPNKGLYVILFKGGEDDDMQRRVTIGGKMTIRRPPFKYAKYTMIHHKKETTSNPKNPRRKPLVDRWKFKDFVESKKWMEDGLNVSLFNSTRSRT